MSGQKNITQEECVIILCNQNRFNVQLDTLRVELNLQVGEQFH